MRPSKVSIEKNRKAHEGAKHTEEWKRIKSKQMKNLFRNGKFPTKETKRKQSIAKVGEKNPMFGKHSYISVNQRRNHSKWMKGRWVGKKNPNFGNQILKGKRNPMFGKHWSEERKRKRSKKLKLEGRWVGEKNPNFRKDMKGEKNPNFGKCYTEEWKRERSEATRGEKNALFGKTLSEDHIGKMRKHMLNGGALHAISFVKNPSYPQIKMCKETKRWGKKNNYTVLGADGTIGSDFHVGNYLPDVAILELKIVLEYDGYYVHFTDEGIKRDKKRDRFIESEGWKVYHFTCDTWLKKHPSLGKINIDRLDEILLRLNQ